MGYRTIVVGTDGSDTAMRAVDKASVLAAKVGGRLILVSACSEGVTRDDAAGILASAAARAGSLGADAETLVQEGPVDEVILDVAGRRQADLLVVGNVGMGKAKRFRLGPIPERIAGEAACDVLIVFTKIERVLPSDPIYNRILAGTDGSATANEAARKAFDLGMTLGIGVLLIYVAGDRVVGSIVLEETVKTKPRALGVKTMIVEGDPSQQICDVAKAEGIGLIVVGNRGMSGARRYVLGSVPSKVAHGAPTDVLIAKTAGRVVGDLTPGTGGVVDSGGRKLAVYKAEDGSLVAVSPRCTHMGCTVDWNASAHVWECPCHGSRYSPDGRVVRGPSEKDLEPAEIGEL